MWFGVTPAERANRPAQICCGEPSPAFAIVSWPGLFRAFATSSLSPSLGVAEPETSTIAADDTLTIGTNALVRLRNVADSAEVNQGMIHYFFRSKEALFQEAYLRCGTPMVEERLRLLDAQEAAVKGGPIPLERLVEIFLTPAFTLAMSGVSGPAFLRMQAHLQLDGTRFGNDLRRLLYDESSRRFLAAFARSLPGVSREEVSWRFIFMLGTYQYALADTGRIESISDGLCSGRDFAGSLRQMMPFIVAAMRAPGLAART